MSSINVGIPSGILNLIQTGLIERAFHDALYPALLYRSEAMQEEWEGNIGTQIFMSRAGLIQPTTTPIVAGVDPTPQVVPFEQWLAQLVRFANTVDVHMPTAAVSNADLFVRTIQQLGLHAGQSVNRLARDAMFQAYLSGATALTVASLTTDTVLNVASINGFTSVVTSSTTRPSAVSPSTPLTILVGSGAAQVQKQVIGFVQNNPNDPLGPGQLILSSSIGTAFAARTAVQSSAAPKILRAGGGDSIDSITSADSFTLQDVMNAVAILRKNNVQPHPDGYYHGHIDVDGNAQLFTDQAWQRLNTALPNGAQYQEGFIGTIGQVMFFLNSESPRIASVNSAVQSGTSLNALYASELGAEVMNDAGTEIARTIITGRGAMYEKWLNEERYVSEAGVTGKLGEFDIVNNGLGLQQFFEHIRLYLRAPLDRLGDMVSATWSISTCFPVPSDVLAFSSPALFKRAVVIEFGT